MKFIHTADIHLDSPMNGVSDGKIRRYELLKALSNMAEYADNNGIEAIVVAGDLFDDKFVADATIRNVAEIINRSRARWFVLRGNHGDITPYNKLREFCNTCCFFGDQWTTFRMGKTVFCGKELTPDDQQPWGALPIDKDDFNVVVLHGDVDSAAYGLIDGKALAANPVNYVALGHRHALQPLTFGRHKGAYCGTLEARGFDETEPTGFIVVDTVSGDIGFVNQALRRVVTRQVDLSRADSDVAAERIIADAVADESPRNYLNLILSGEVPADLHAARVANNFLSGKFFALRVKDNTKVHRDLAAIAAEASLRGEFVKLAMRIDDERARNEILDMGLAVLAGEDLQ